MPSSVSILITASVKSSIGSLRALVLPTAGEFTSGIELVSRSPGYDELFPEPISPILIHLLSVFLIWNFIDLTHYSTPIIGGKP